MGGRGECRAATRRTSRQKRSRPYTAAPGAATCEAVVQSGFVQPCRTLSTAQPGAQHDRLSQIDRLLPPHRCSQGCGELFGLETAPRGRPCAPDGPANYRAPDVEKVRDAEVNKLPAGEVKVEGGYLRQVNAQVQAVLDLPRA